MNARRPCRLPPHANRFRQRGAAAVEFKLDVPGKFILVDHALSRLEKGLVGILNVEGPANPEVFKVIDPQKSAVTN